MAALMLTRDDVIERSRSLPSFPRIITEIMATLDDPDGNLKVLVHCINHDPLIAARVLSVANMASVRGRRDSEVNDVYTATSLVGLSRVREIALISSLNGFVDGMPRESIPAAFWQHSVAVGVCCEELALHITAPVSNDAALVAGLLHDIGQLWLHTFNAQAYGACWREAITGGIGIDQVEREHFGVDHSTIGAWLAEHWELPAGIVAAIRGHHAPDPASDLLLVPLVHVAEVLSNALDLTDRPENRVTFISGAACQQLGLVWDEDIRSLFGRMEARSRHANTFFRT